MSVTYSYIIIHMRPSFLLTSLLAALLPPAAALAGFGKAPPKGKKAAKAAYDPKRAMERQMNAWNALQDESARAADVAVDAVDVYVRSGASTKFWFVGKCGARADACEDAAAIAVVAQKRLVLSHAKLLQMELQVRSLRVCALPQWMATPR